MQDFHYFQKHRVKIDDFENDGYILDIGGGGEGIIGQLKGNQVVSIDLSWEELSEAHNDSLKILMDARELKFLDNTFSTITAFYSLMYMKSQDHVKVLNEVLRVLKHNGMFRIWDIELKKPAGIDSPGFVIPLEVILPNQTIETGYGAYWPRINYDLDYYENLATQTGFTIIEKKKLNSSFSLVLQKKSGG